MERLETEENIIKLYDELASIRNNLALTLRNDRELTNEKIITQKLSHIDGMIKHLLKYRSLLLKTKPDV